MNRWLSRWCVYSEPRDWWVGLYISPTHLYFCPVPCLVFRYRRA